MPDNSESLVTQAMEVYGDYFRDIQALSDLLRLAERNPKNTDQITLIKTAIQLATGVGSFTRHHSDSSLDWDNRQ